jgi:hypothetical protein
MQVFDFFFLSPFLLLFLWFVALRCCHQRWGAEAGEGAAVGI